MARHLLPSAILFGLIAAANAEATILPPNNLDREDNPNAKTGITQEEFNAVIEKAETFYAPIVESHGAKLRINRLWSNSTVNASAMQSGSTWNVNMYGGLARRKEITPDGFALVLCHELGHHLGGYYFTSNWAANEGQSDYFATLTCSRELWLNEVETNAAHRETVNPVAKEKCDASWESEADQNLCYRTMAASKSISDLLAALSRGTVNFDTPDTSRVSRTDNAHPDAQCRLDTYMAGAICTATWDTGVIPAKSLGSSRNTRRGEEESAQYTCSEAHDETIGVRPTCWFKSLL